MVGLGEEWDEVLAVMDDLRGVDVDILTIGQYLQPTKQHLPIARYYHPDEFTQLAERRLRPRLQVGGVGAAGAVVVSRGWAGADY